MKHVTIFNLLILCLTAPLIYRCSKDTDSAGNSKNVAEAYTEDPSLAVPVAFQSSADTGSDTAEVNVEESPVMDYCESLPVDSAVRVVFQNRYIGAFYEGKWYHPDTLPFSLGGETEPVLMRRLHHEDVEPLFLKPEPSGYQRLYPVWGRMFHGIKEYDRSAFAFSDTLGDFYLPSQWALPQENRESIFASLKQQMHTLLQDSLSLSSEDLAREWRFNHTLSSAYLNDSSNIVASLRKVGTHRNSSLRFSAFVLLIDGKLSYSSAYVLDEDRRSHYIDYFKNPYGEHGDAIVVFDDEYIRIFEYRDTLVQLQKQIRYPQEGYQRAKTEGMLEHYSDFMPILSNEYEIIRPSNTHMILPPESYPADITEQISAKEWNALLLDRSGRTYSLSLVPVELSATLVPIVYEDMIEYYGSTVMTNLDHNIDSEKELLLFISGKLPSFSQENLYGFFNSYEGDNQRNLSEGNYVTLHSLYNSDVELYLDSRVVAYRMNGPEQGVVYEQLISRGRIANPVILLHDIDGDGIPDILLQQRYESCGAGSEWYLFLSSAAGKGELYNNRGDAVQFSESAQQEREIVRLVTTGFSSAFN
ncbi:hypothetical protein CHISP_2439 [Chitinispirillum alkaliphilum]|nr:hypothetical protein CHISP_2439 [Chitinispirillum alkaliphilum]